MVIERTISLFPRKATSRSLWSLFDWSRINGGFICNKGRFCHIIVDVRRNIVFVFQDKDQYGPGWLCRTQNYKEDILRNNNEWR